MGEGMSDTKVNPLTLGVAGETICFPSAPTFSSSMRFFSMANRSSFSLVTRFSKGFLASLVFLWIIVGFLKSKSSFADGWWPERLCGKLGFVLIKGLL